MFKFEAEAKNYFSNPSIFLHTRYGLPVEEPTINYSNNFKKLNAIFKFDKNLIEDEEIETKIIISDNNQSFLLIIDDENKI